MIPVESFIRNAVLNVPNAYCLIFFACCREVYQISKFNFEKFQNKKLITARGKTDIKNKNANLIL